MFEVAEYLREEALRNLKVGPRKYEHWEITVTRELDKNEMLWKWELSAKWLLKRAPTENATNWLLDLSDEVSKKNIRTLFKTQGKLVKFSWTEERDPDDERKRTDRKSESDALRNFGAEEDSGDLAGKISLDSEEDD